MIVIPMELLNRIVQYLALQPWGDVNPLIQDINTAVRGHMHSMEAPPQEGPEEPADSETGEGDNIPREDE